MRAGHPTSTLDASGLVVAPGFIDVHSHADFTLPLQPTADSLVHQGITTAVIGNCGTSPSPLLDETRESVVRAMQSADRPIPWERWSTFRSYIKFLDATGTSLNVTPLVGLGTIRAGVMGYANRQPSPAELRLMQGEVDKALQSGAFGASSGLIYPPGMYSSTEELVSVVRAVGQAGGLYTSHIRNEGARLMDAVTEAIRIGEETGASVQISHLKAMGRENWDSFPRALRIIEQASAEGIDVHADVYPYLATSTQLSAMLPEWAQEGGRGKTLERLGDSDARKRMARAMQQQGLSRHADWDRVLISRSPRETAYEGHSVSELARQDGIPPTEWVFDALRRTHVDIGMIDFCISERNLRLALAHPLSMVGTDGSGLCVEGVLSSGLPHPRSYGTYPRVLSRFVRDQNILSLEEAVHKMTGLPARKLRLDTRGTIKEGSCADIVVFDPKKIVDQATYTSPHQYPEGIIHVLVNGQFVIRNGVHTGARPGVSLRRASS
jgi:N-acyl-D-amino-acid deacylase